MDVISIITPVSKQDEKYIKRCYDSLLNQLQPNLEWIVILEEYNEEIEAIKKGNDVSKKLEIKVSFDPDLINVYQKRNEGIKLASGKYVYFLDVDDMLHDHTLYTLMESAKSTPDLYDIVLGSLKETNVIATESIAYNRLLNRLLENRIGKPKVLDQKKYRNSALNTLFKRDFILENKIEFEESMTGFSDIVFTSKAYSKTEMDVVFDKDAVYLKFVRNDPINNPSISQAQNGIELYPRSMAQAISSLEEGSTYRNILINKFLKTYHYKYLDGIYNTDPSDVYKETWSAAFRSIGLDRIIFNRPVHKKEIEHLVAGNYKQATKMANRRLNFRTLKKIKKKPGTYRRVLYQKLFTTKLSVKKNYVLYESF
ncbi:glycosyltransferase family A protein [Bacillus sp. JCM 19041]|uniref:glycosyltransferase family A protein n=1 Tax=Bacillus sp. JCM 19041 TaxID=1460637 RepID=UPI0006CF3C33